MMLYLLLFCVIFSTTFGHRDGFTELTEDTDTIFLTRDDTAIILEPESYATVDFWIKNDSFDIYIYLQGCLNQTASTSFTFFGGYQIDLMFNLTDESYNKSMIDVTVLHQKNITTNHNNSFIQFTVNLKEKQVSFNDKINPYELGNIVTFPFHGENGTEPRVTFFASNTGQCQIFYGMHRSDMIPLKADHSHHDATTAKPSPLYNVTTKPSKDESSESWYEGSTFKKIVYAYLWILSCGLAFIMGICAAGCQRRSHTPVHSVEIGSASV